MGTGVKRRKNEWFFTPVALKAEEHVKSRKLRPNSNLIQPGLLSVGLRYLKPLQHPTWNWSIV